MRNLLIGVVAIWLSAGMFSCASVYQAANIGLDSGYQPVALPDYKQEQAVVGAGSSFILDSQLFNAAYRLGADVDTYATWGKSLTKAVTINFGGSLGGFLIQNKVMTNPEGAYGYYLSYGLTARFNAALIAGSPSVSRIYTGPQIIYSFEQGPYYDFRKQFPTEASEYQGAENLSPTGHTATMRWILLWLAPTSGSGQLSIGGTFGIADPDFPRNFFDHQDRTNFVETMLVSYQNEWLWVSGEMNLSLPFFTDGIKATVGVFLK